MASIPQLHHTDVTNALAVDKNPARSNPLFLPQTVNGNQQRLAILQHLHPLSSHPHTSSQLSMLDQMTVFAMNRHETVWPSQRQHQFQFFLTGVAGNMHLAGLFIKNFGATPIEQVDQAADGLFVSGDKLGGQNDRITRFQRQLSIVIHSHARQYAQRLALAAGSDHHHFAARQIAQFPQLDKSLRRDLQIAELTGNGGIGHHAATVDQYLTAASHSRIDHLLDAVNVGRKGRHQYQAVTAWQNLG